MSRRVLAPIVEHHLPSISRRSLLRSVLAAPVVAASSPLPRWATAGGADRPLLDQLRAGGLILYFRHSLTARSGQPDDDLSSCESQRNLTEAGRRLAADIGDAFRELEIPVGVVRSSPYCRCVDTARLAFGRVAVAGFLETNGDATDAAEQRRLAQLAAALQSTPSSAPHTILMAHGNNLVGLAARHGYPLLRIEEAEAVVFRPRPGALAQVVGRVQGSRWRRLGTP